MEEKYLQQWSEKLSIPVEDIKLEFSKVLAEEKSNNPDAPEDQSKQRTLRRLALTYKKQLRSPAVGFEGIIIGESDCIDVVAKKRREAIELFKNDPNQAVSQGITNEEGTPLDARAQWANGKTNFNFGKPLPEHNYLKNVFGIAIKSKFKDEKPRLFSITMSGKKAMEIVPTFTPLRFMAIDKTTPEMGNEKYILNPSTFTNFEPVDIVLPAYKDLLQSHCSNLTVDMKDLGAYHDKTKDDFNRLVITTGDVSSLNLEPTAFGSRIMNIDDGDNLEDLDAKGVTCWIPERQNINFAESSKVIVIGRTNQGKLKDEQGNLTEELGDVTINVFGIYALPEYKVELPETIQPLTEGNTKMAEEETKTDPAVEAADEAEKPAEAPAETPAE